MAPGDPLEAGVAIASKNAVGHEGSTLQAMNRTQWSRGAQVTENAESHG